MKQQEDKAPQQGWNQKAIDRVHNHWQYCANGRLELAEKLQKPKEAADIIKQYEEILRTKRKGYRKGIVNV